MTDQLTELEAMIDALYNFTNVFNLLAGFYSEENGEETCEKHRQGLSFTKAMYEDLANQVLQHPKVNEMLTPEQIAELNKFTKGE